MRVLTIANQKGGQCKSTVAAHLAYRMAEEGLRVAVMDFDPQGSLSNLTFSENRTDDKQVTLPDARFSLTQMLQQKNIARLKNKVSQAEELNVSLGDAKFAFFHSDHEDEEDFSRTVIHAENVSNFQAHLADLKRFGYDCVLIDTQGSLSGLTRMALQHSTHVLIPFQLGGYDISALKKTMSVVKGYKHLKNVGQLACRVVTGSSAVKKDLDELTKMGVVLPCHLAQRLCVATAAQNRLPVWHGAKSASHKAAAKEWRKVTEYVLSNLQ
jgi:chromosome partitioning protein